MKKLTNLLLTAIITTMSFNILATTVTDFPKTFETEEQAIEYTNAYNSGKTYNDLRAFTIPVYKKVKGKTETYYRSLLPTDEQLNKELENLYLYVVNKDSQMEMHKLALQNMDSQSLVMHIANHKCGIAYDVYNDRYKVVNPLDLGTEDSCRNGMEVTKIPTKEFIDGKKLDLDVDKETKALSIHKKDSLKNKMLGDNII